MLILLNRKSGKAFGVNTVANTVTCMPIAAYQYIRDYDSSSVHLTLPNLESIKLIRSLITKGQASNLSSSEVRTFILKAYPELFI